MLRTAPATRYRNDNKLRGNSGFRPVENVKISINDDGRHQVVLTIEGTKPKTYLLSQIDWKFLTGKGN